MKILILRKCEDCNKAQIPMMVDDFPFEIEYSGQVFHFIKNSYGFCSPLYTGVKYPDQKEADS